MTHNEARIEARLKALKHAVHDDGIGTAVFKHDNDYIVFELNELEYTPNSTLEFFMFNKEWREGKLFTHIDVVMRLYELANYEQRAYMDVVISDYLDHSSVDYLNVIREMRSKFIELFDEVIEKFIEDNMNRYNDVLESEKHSVKPAERSVPFLPGDKVKITIDNISLTVKLYSVEYREGNIIRLSYVDRKFIGGMYYAEKHTIELSPNKKNVNALRVD